MLKITFLGGKYIIEVFIRLPRSHLKHGICFRSLIETAESAFAVIKSDIETAEAMISNFYLKFLGEFKSIFEKALAPKSGPKGE
jgi:hypothetical protein